MSGRATGAQRSSDEGAFADFFARSAGRLCGFYVGLDAVGTLRCKSDSQGDELAVLPRDRAAIAAHDLIEREPRIELSGSKFAHLLQKPQITGIMVVLTHSYPPDFRIHFCASRLCAHEHNACLTTKGHALREARPFNLGGPEQSSSGGGQDFGTDPASAVCCVPASWPLEDSSSGATAGLILTVARIFSSRVNTASRSTGATPPLEPSVSTPSTNS